MARQFEIPIVLMRGGTSKGVFVREALLPASGPARDAFVLALLGSPDPMQIDGLGGTHSSTSKLMAVSPATEQGIDVEYLFGQVAVDRPIVDWAGNCGNLTAAVGAYAVDEGLVEAVEPVTTVRMLNRNTATVVLAHVPVTEDRAATIGQFHLPGVPGSGARIDTEYLDPGGAVTGATLPTRLPAQTITPSDGLPIEVSIVDVTAPTIFVRGSDVGLTSDSHPDAVNSDAAALARLESIRAAAAVLLGFAKDDTEALRSSAALPRLVAVSSGTSNADLEVRGTSMQRVHHACPLTSAMCTAAAAHLAGTIPAETTRRHAAGAVRIAHPRGTIELGVRVDAGVIRSVSVPLTARRLLAGNAYVLTDSSGHPMAW